MRRIFEIYLFNLKRHLENIPTVETALNASLEGARPMQSVSTLRFDAYCVF